MSQNIPAIYQAGVFHPLQPVDWPDGARAEICRLPDSPVTTAKDGGVSNWPVGYFEQTSGALAGEDFERPIQHEQADREEW